MWTRAMHTLGWGREHSGRATHDMCSPACTWACPVQEVGPKVHACRVKARTVARAPPRAIQLEERGKGGKGGKAGGLTTAV
eukprot:365480-Chlamydomonas_euryale.AAC.22